MTLALSYALCLPVALSLCHTHTLSLFLSPPSPLSVPLAQGVVEAYSRPTSAATHTATGEQLSVHTGEQLSVHTLSRLTSAGTSMVTISHSDHSRPIFAALQSIGGDDSHPISALSALSAGTSSSTQHYSDSSRPISAVLRSIGEAGGRAATSASCCTSARSDLSRPIPLDSLPGSSRASSVGADDDIGSDAMHRPGSSGSARGGWDVTLPDHRSAAGDGSHRLSNSAGRPRSASRPSSAALRHHFHSQENLLLHTREDAGSVPNEYEDQVPVCE